MNTSWLVRSAELKYAVLGSLDISFVGCVASWGGINEI